MSILPTLTSQIQPPVDSRWLWAARIATLISTLIFAGSAIWSFLQSGAGFEIVLPLLPYLVAFGWALWCLRSNPPARFGAALAAGLALVLSLVLLAMSISTTLSVIAARERYVVSEPVWGLLAGVEAFLLVAAGLAYWKLRRGARARRSLWAVRILGAAAICLVVVKFFGYVQQAQYMDTWIAPLGRGLALLAAFLTTLGGLWFLRSPAGTQGKEGLHALILILTSSAILSILSALWFVSSVHYLEGMYGPASPAAGLLVWFPTLLACGYAVSATKVFFLLKREGGDVGRLVGAFVLAVAVVLVSANLFPRGERMHDLGAAAVGALRIINTAEITYASTYEGSYSPSLAELGPPPPSTPPTAAAAGLVDQALVTGTKSGYRSTYTPGSRDASGRIVSYTLTARPPQYSRQIRRSFFTDETGVIRWTEEDRNPRADDPRLGE